LEKSLWSLLKAAAMATFGPNARSANVLAFEDVLPVPAYSRAAARAGHHWQPPDPQHPA